MGLLKLESCPGGEKEEHRNHEIGIIDRLLRQHDQDADGHAGCHPERDARIAADPQISKEPVAGEVVYDLVGIGTGVAARGVGAGGAFELVDEIGPVRSLSEERKRLHLAALLEAAHERVLGVENLAQPSGERPEEGRAMALSSLVAHGADGVEQSRQPAGSPLELDDGAARRRCFTNLFRKAPQSLIARHGHLFQN